VRDFTEEMKAMVQWAMGLWEFGNSRANVHLAGFFRNAVVDDETRDIVFMEKIPERVFAGLETTNGLLTASILEFYNVVVFYVLNDRANCADRDGMRTLFERIWEKAIAIFKAADGTPEYEPPELACAFELLSSLLGYSYFLDHAMDVGLVNLMIEKSSQFSSAGTVQTFFAIIKLFLGEDKCENLFTAKLFEAMARLAIRVCARAGGAIDPFGLFQALNRKYWRLLSRCCLVSELLSVSNQLSFRVGRSFCLWIMDLMKVADVDVRRQITGPPLFDLVVRILHSDQPHDIDEIVEPLVKIRDDDAVFWKTAFEKAELRQALESLQNDLSDPESLDRLGELQRQLFPDIWMCSDVMSQ
jgi:hypothetical protein